MDNILIESNNNTEVISIANENDISYCIEKYMGIEFANYVKKYYSEIVESFKEESIIAKKNACDYESGLEEKNRLLCHVAESLTELLDYIEHSDHTDMQKVLEQIKELKINISSEL